MSASQPACLPHHPAFGSIAFLARKLLQEFNTPSSSPPTHLFTWWIMPAPTTTTIHLRISQSKYGIVIIHQKEEVPKAVIMDGKKWFKPTQYLPNEFSLSLSLSLVHHVVLILGPFLHKMSASIHMNSGKDNHDHFTNASLSYRWLQAAAEVHYICERNMASLASTYSWLL